MSVPDVNILSLEAPVTRTSPAAWKARSQRGWVTFSCALFLVGAGFLANTESLTQALLYLIAGVLGLALYHAHYGFTTAWRSFLVYGRGAGIRAQMITFFIANILFLPVLLHGHWFGHSVSGYVFPVGLSVLAGSFLFGLGMQLGDGCASGTLYHTGGGDVRGILTLIGFVLGSVLGSLNFPWWMKTPHIQPISLLKVFGPAEGFVLELVMLAAVFGLTLLVERRRNGPVIPIIQKREHFDWRAIVKGPWSLITGGVVLAVGNVLVLLLSGKPWGVTFAFALWGAKIAQGIGLPIAHWGYWQISANSSALHHSIFHDATTVLDLGVIVGALLAASLAGRLPNPYLRRFPTRMLAAVVLGGVFMGYGARIAFGCNIGSYFSGIASFSLHGWLWFISALFGSAIGVKLRPLFAHAN